MADVNDKVEWRWIDMDSVPGSMRVTNGDIDILVSPDFSGQVTNESGDFMEFSDLREFIKAAKLLEEALVDRYGGWK